jgi:hypothetical protein
MKHTIHFDTAEGIRSNLSELTGVRVEDIDGFVESVEDWEYAERDYRTLWTDFQRVFGCSPVIEEAILFHGCRCIPGTEFKEGLLPNDQAIDLIWQHTYGAVGENLSFPDWKTWKSDFENRSPDIYLKRLRSSDIRQRGPLGKFVREEWFLEWCDSNHYIHKAPEVVDAVLKTFPEIDRMKEFYLKNTLGCRGHFRVPCQNPRRLGHGLVYLCDKRHCVVPQQYRGSYGLESMEGQAIPFEDVLKVEFLDESLENSIS